jgi:hypothetical protein
MLVADLSVATVPELASLPFTLLPVVLGVLHLGAVLGVLVVVQCVFETALATLAQAEDQEGCDSEHASSGRTTVHTDVGSLAKVVPLL